MRISKIVTMRFNLSDEDRRELKEEYLNIKRLDKTKETLPLTRRILEELTE